MSLMSFEDEGGAGQYLHYHFLHLCDLWPDLTFNLCDISINDLKPPALEENGCPSEQYVESLMLFEDEVEGEAGQY